MQTLSLVFIFAAAIFVLMSPYTCYYPCPFSSMAWPGLTRHQQHCAIYGTAQALRMEQRKVHKSGKKPIATLEHHKKRIQVKKHVLWLITTQDNHPPLLQHPGGSLCSAPNTHFPIKNGTDFMNSLHSTPSGTMAPPPCTLVPPLPLPPSNIILTRTRRVASHLLKHY
jgi:hypothetical protein